MAWRPWMSCAFDYDLSQPWLQEVYFFSPRCHDCRNFSKFIMNKACNFQCKVTYIKITNTLISVLRRKSLKESRDLFVHNSLYFHRHSNSGPPFFSHLVPPAIMVWIFVWKYIFEPFIHILQHFVLQLSRSTNFCFQVQLPYYYVYISIWLI